MTSLARAAYYWAILDRASLTGGVRERDGGSGRRWSERHLQCIWYDARLRPELLNTSDAQTVRVIDPGHWNLEAGPDFRLATLELADGTRLSGDIEIHVHPRDWEAHRHAANPLYANVVGHVSYFEAPPPPTLPPKVLRIAMAPLLSANPAFSFDDIDIAAYPHAAIPATPRPCAAALAGQPERAALLLDAAGEFRIQAKALRLRDRLAQQPDARQLFYEEIMAALGYKQNSPAFRSLAQTLPLREWDRSADTTAAYGRLLGAAGLLPQPETVSDPALAPFTRKLWDAWWRTPIETPLDANAWVMNNIRPANHPIRRLAAAAALFSGGHTILERLALFPATPPQEWFRAAALLFEQATQWPFWNNRLTLTGQPVANAGALLGANRTAAIVLNIVIPWLTADGRLDAAVLDFLPPEDLSAPVRATAHRLFGRDHNPYALYANNGLRIQGLLQIHADFCLSARAECDGCPLAQALRDEQNPGTEK